MMRIEKSKQRAVLSYRNQFVSLLILSGLASTATAVEYSAGGSLDFQVTHNDNLRMSQSSDKVEVVKYLATPVLDLGAKTENTNVQLLSIFYFNRYDQSQYDSKDQNIQLNMTHKFENSSIGLNANLVRESTVTSELLSSGIVGETAKRTIRYVASPSWTYYFSESDLVQLSGTYTDQQYEDDVFTGYKNTAAQIDWVHVFTERLKLIGSLNYKNYHSDDQMALLPGNAFFPVDPEGNEYYVPRGYFGIQTFSTRTKSKGAQLGIDYNWSEQTLLKASVGTSKSTDSYPSKSAIDVCNTDQYKELVEWGYEQQVGAACDGDTNQMFTAQVDWSWKTELQNVGLSLVKSTQPTANGYTVDATQLTSNWSYKLTELDQVFASVTAVRNRSIGDSSESLRNSDIANRDYASANLAYRRQVNENWFVAATYQYNWQQYTELDSKANSSVVSLSVRYQPQDWQWSR